MRLILWLAILGFLVAWIGHAYSAECKASPNDRSYWSWRSIDGKKCWYRGSKIVPKSQLHWSDPVRIKVPESIRAESPKPIVLYPSLQQMMPEIAPNMLDRTELTLSYRLLDIDELTNKVPDPPDACCWPDLVKDANGEWVLK